MVRKQKKKKTKTMDLFAGRRLLGGPGLAWLSVLMTAGAKREEKKYQFPVPYCLEPCSELDTPKVDDDGFLLHLACPDSSQLQYRS